MRGRRLLLISLLLVSSIQFGCKRRVAEKAHGIASSWFSSFPVGATYSFSSDADALRVLTLRDRSEQIRDWTLTSLVSVSGQSAGQTAKSLSGVRVWRANASSTEAAGLQTGPARIVVLPDGYLALVPKESPAEETARIGSLLDRVRFRSGEPQGVVEVFEYTADPYTGECKVTRQPSRSVAEFFGGGTEFRKIVVKTRKDVEAFLNSVDDLTSASVSGGALTLEGRRASLRPGQARFQISNAAEVFQSGRKWRVAHAQAQSLDDEYRRKWSHVQAPVEEIARLNAESKAEGEKVQTRMDDLIRQAGPEPDGCGFSLDPQPEHAPKPVFQQARYICELAGTEAGMVLFYTDLNAKLWAMDFEQSFPWQVSGFRPIIRLALSKDEEGKVESLPQTRIWFAPRQSRSYATENMLSFDPEATRVFAKSSLVPGIEEQTANPASAWFVNWWNDHYGEIASYEPEYARLNQIIKWSMLMAWLGKHQQTALFSILDGVPVKRDRYFPDWATDQGARLTYQNWRAIHFDPKGGRGQTSETMEILHASYEQQRTETETITREMSGGISFADSKDLEHAEIPPSFPTYTTQPASDGGEDSFATAPGDSRRRTRVSVDGDRVEIASFDDSVPQESLGVNRTGNTVRATYRPAAGERTRRVTAALADSPSGFLTPGLMMSEGISAVIKTDGSYLIRTGLDGKYSRLDTRTNQKSDTAVDTTNVRLTDAMGPNGYITIFTDRSNGRAFQAEIHNRGPPLLGEGAKVTLTDGGKEFRGWREDGRIYLARSDLPDDYANDTTALWRLARSVVEEDAVSAFAEGNNARFAEEAVRNPRATRELLGAHLDQPGELDSIPGYYDAVPMGDGPQTGRYLIRMHEIPKYTSMSLGEARKQGLAVFYENAAMAAGSDPSLGRPDPGDGNYSGARKAQLPPEVMQKTGAIEDVETGRYYIRDPQTSSSSRVSTGVVYFALHK